MNIYLFSSKHVQFLFIVILIIIYYSTKTRNKVIYVYKFLTFYRSLKWDFGQTKFGEFRRSFARIHFWNGNVLDSTLIPVFNKTQAVAIIFSFIYFI